MFQPGHQLSGSRKGIPNKGTAELKALAREYGPEAVQKLAKLMRGKDRHTTALIKKLTETPLESPEARKLAAKLLTALDNRKPENELGAARELLDRGYGKAAQPLTGEDGTGPAKILIERHIIDPRVVEGEVADASGTWQKVTAEIEQEPNVPIIHVMRHPTVEEASDSAQPTAPNTSEPDDS